MFPNLRAEQARWNLSDQAVADKIGISRVSYGSKKKTGRFTVKESKELCDLFKVDFDYLFARDKE